MQTIVYSRASDVPPIVPNTLREDPVKANVILPTWEKCCALDHMGRSPINHRWIVLYLPGPQPRVGFVLSVTDTNMDTGYPVFLFCTIQSAQLHVNLASVVPALQLLVNTLAANVPVSRVYSVFAHVILATHFRQLWANTTGVSLVDAPYYDSWLTFLPRGIQLSPDANRPDPRDEIRPAVQGDIQEIARLCRMFADDSPPFTLSMQAAMREAVALIRDEMIWVLRFNGKLASIVAFTRNSTQVATLTKVYTDPTMRGHQCAERLVRRVCYELMQQPGRETVALYVGRFNRAANVYRRVGFQDSPADGVEQWVEYGFGPDGVSLGHW